MGEADMKTPVEEKKGERKWGMEGERGRR